MLRARKTQSKDDLAKRRIIGHLPFCCKRLASFEKRDMESLHVECLLRRHLRCTLTSATSKTPHPPREVKAFGPLPPVFIFDWCTFGLTPSMRRPVTVKVVLFLPKGSLCL